MFEKPIQGTFSQQNLRRLDLENSEPLNFKIKQDQTLQEPLLRFKPELGDSTNQDVNKLTPAQLEQLRGLSDYFNPPVTQEEHDKAVAELDAKVSSIGISYKDANDKMKQIEEQYSGDKYFDEWYELDESSQDTSVMYTNNKDIIEGIGINKPKYIKHRVFNPNKLPEPAKSEYLEARASKKEIEINNTELVSKVRARIKTEGSESPASASGISNLFKEPELTPKQKAARENLDKQVSSKGVKYADAKAKMKEIQDKYSFMDNPDVWRFVPNEHQPKGIGPLHGHNVFDPEKIPNEADKKAYYEALDNVLEIEKKNYALLVQAGLERTKDPNSIENIISDGSMLY